MADEVALPPGKSKLTLRGRHLSPEKAQKLAESLPNNTTLKKLHLGNNNIGDAGLTAIAAALETNTTLQKLNLGNSHVGDAGAMALANALRKNCSLEIVNLWSNPIGHDAKRDMVKLFVHNYSLTKVVGFEDSLQCEMIWDRNGKLSDSEKKQWMHRAQQPNYPADQKEKEIEDLARNEKDSRQKAEEVEEAAAKKAAAAKSAAKNIPPVKLAPEKPEKEVEEDDEEKPPRVQANSDASEEIRKLREIIERQGAAIQRLTVDLQEEKERGDRHEKLLQQLKQVLT